MGGVKVCWGTGVKGVCVLWGEKGGRKEKKTKNKKTGAPPPTRRHSYAGTYAQKRLARDGFCGGVGRMGGKNTNKQTKNIPSTVSALLQRRFILF